MVGGNTKAQLIKLGEAIRNDCGERIPSREPVCELTGWMDLMSGTSNYSNNAKLQESSHIFLTDYAPALVQDRGANMRLEVGGCDYDVLLIDDPIGMHEHMEIYLKYIGVL